MKIAIVGAGIGGLTTALFLEKLGVHAEIFEQSAQLKPIGAGIILAHNAMQVFAELGLESEISALGNPLTSVNITTSALNPISRIDTGYFDYKYGVNTVAIKREQLQHLLVSRLQITPIHLNKQVVNVASSLPNDNSATTQQKSFAQRTKLFFLDGETAEFDAIIGADGIHSNVRKAISTTSVIRTTNQVCWRGIAHITLPNKYKSELNELWGGGSRFGFVELSPQKNTVSPYGKSRSDNAVYWYALHNNKKQVEQSDLLNHFHRYHPVVHDIILKTPQEHIFKSDISDLAPMDNWHQGNVCLIGDAAHATTPNMGQGACQAIEDAYVLSHSIEQLITSQPYLTQGDSMPSSSLSLTHAFTNFQQVRKPKTDMVVSLSRHLGAISQLKNPILSSVRNVAMRAVPSTYNIKRTDRIYQLAAMTP